MIIDSLDSKKASSRYSIDSSAGPPPSFKSTADESPFADFPSAHTQSPRVINSAFHPPANPSERYRPLVAPQNPFLNPQLELDGQGHSNQYSLASASSITNLNYSRYPEPQGPDLEAQRAPPSHPSTAAANRPPYLQTINEKRKPLAWGQSIGLGILYLFTTPLYMTGYTLNLIGMLLNSAGMIISGLGNSLKAPHEAVQRLLKGTPPTPGK